MDAFKKGLVTTADGSLTLRHPLYDEEFHAREGARFETEQLYIQGSGFFDRVNDAGVEADCAVLDIGLGLGYNALMTIETWWRSPGRGNLSVHSLEISPELVTLLGQIDCVWKEGWSEDWRQWSASLVPISADRWKMEANHPASGQRLLWTVAVGDATAMELGTDRFDFIWQDAFSPRKNPELWTSAWFARLKSASRPKARLLTYSVARLVKDHLVEAGWSYEKFKAPGGNKKEWLRARLNTI